MKVPGTMLLLPIDPEAALDLQSGLEDFNKNFLFRCGPPAQIQAHTLSISAYDVADFFRYIKRSPKNELALFRLKRLAMRQIEGMGNEDIILESLRNIHWNQPDI